MKSEPESSKQAGFTFLELLLSIALVGVLAALSLPVSQSWIQTNDLVIAETMISQSFRRAQVLAQAVEGDSAWGVSIDDSENNKIVVFQGDSFVVRDALYDEEFDLPDTIAASGVTEVVFTVFTGLPQTTGSVTLTADNNQTRTFSINAKGIVSYE